MQTIVIIGSTGTISKNLVELHKKENCIEASRSLETKGNQYHLDLADFECIKEFLHSLETISVDILYVNSGIVCDQEDTKDGIDCMMMVNAVGPYYLVKEFLKTHPMCKIIVTSSVSILKADLKFPPKNYRHMYRNTKLLEHILIRNLKVENPNYFISFAHPGIVYTQLSAKLHSKIIIFWVKHFGNSSQNAARILQQAKELNSIEDWICPRGWFSLRGRSCQKKISRDLTIKESIKTQILQIEKELEEKYGI
ncbi:SDR family NAD(P)-dependent oxidoreductase [bacterium]|nr:SDR family NAD(P)-dependent oxidoreductase [bacterium]